MKEKIPHARVVTGDGPVLGVVRQLWSDATETVVECLEAAARAKIVRDPEAQMKETSRRDFRNAIPFDEWNNRYWYVSPNRVMHAVNDALRRNDLKRRVIGLYRLEATCENAARLRCAVCGGAWESKWSDTQLAASDEPTRVMIVAMVESPCPRCTTAMPDPDVVLGED